MQFYCKNLHQADLFSPGNFYAGMKPKNSWKNIQETQKYLKILTAASLLTNCLVTVNKEYLYAWILHNPTFCAT